MPGPAGAGDPALEQAKLAQLAPHAWQDSWQARPGSGRPGGCPGQSRQRQT